MIMHIYISAENHACMAMDARVYPYMYTYVYIYIAIERIFIITTYVYLGYLLVFYRHACEPSDPV